MNFSSVNQTKLNALLYALLTVVAFSGCEVEDGDNELDILNESPFYVKINIEGNVIDVNHGLDYQVGTDLSYENGCEILFNDCSSPDRKIYLASSFGPNEQNLLNLAFTNFDLNNINLENPDLLALANNLPTDDNNSLLFSSGTMEEGITSGNVFIGTVDYKYSYINDQKSWARFRITEINNEVLNEVATVGIRFEIDCILYDETKNREIIVRNGEGYLPFHLIIKN